MMAATPTKAMLDEAAECLGYHLESMGEAPYGALELLVTEIERLQAENAALEDEVHRLRECLNTRKVQRDLYPVIKADRDRLEDEVRRLREENEEMRKGGCRCSDGGSYKSGSCTRCGGFYHGGVGNAE